MPRPGQTPGPAYETGQELPKGSATDVAQLQQAVPFAQTLQALASQDAGEPEFTPGNAAEAFMFSPTDRGQEPITAGAPFGDGSNYVRQSYESDDDLMQRVASSIAAKPDAPAEVKEFLARVMRGE